MQKLILQPCGEGDPQKHFHDTIINGVDIALIQQYLTPGEFIEISKIYGGKKIEVWGVVPGRNGANIGKYNKTSANDLVMMTAKGQVIYVGSICYKVHNKDLALRLRGEDEKTQTWEYIYFLIGGKEETLPVSQIIDLIGYKSNYVVQGFSVVDESKSQRVIEKYGNLESALTDIGSEYSKPTAEEVKFIDTKIKNVNTPEEAERIIEQISQEIFARVPREKQRIVNAIVRDPKLARLIKERVSYCCEICGRNGFETEAGGLYAEAHHLLELSNGGLDLPGNMICVCPDCHRKLHNAKKEVVSRMLEKFIITN